MVSLRINLQLFIVLQKKECQTPSSGQHLKNIFKNYWMILLTYDTFSKIFFLSPITDEKESINKYLRMFF